MVTPAVYVIYQSSEQFLTHVARLLLFLITENCLLISKQSKRTGTNEIFLQHFQRILARNQQVRTNFEAVFPGFGDFL